MGAEPLPSLRGWVPVQAAMHEGRLLTDLCLVGDRRFSEPFFEDSIAACMRRPFHSVFRHRLDMATLARWLEQHPGLRPRGFIFHMSRCGSTLMSQLLAASPAHRVISEAGPIDAALRAADGVTAVSEDTRKGWLQAMVGMLGQLGHAEERRLFIKFDSWHARLLPLIQRAFPGVPWVFMMRDPVEVIVSHLRRPGAQMVPGMLGLGLPGIEPQEAACLPREDYCARMLGAIFETMESAFSADPQHGLLVDYAGLPAAVDARVFPHFGLQPDAGERDAMNAAWRQDAKRPAFEFSPDSDTKRREATDAVRTAAERWVAPAYRRLLARVEDCTPPQAQR